MANARTDSSAARDPAPAVTRALRILQLLEEAAGQPLSLSDLARGLGAAKSSTSNICAVLEDGGMIRRTEGGYRLGLRTAELGGAFAAGFNQVREFFRVIETIPALRREVVQVAMRDHGDALHLACHEGRQHRLGTRLGSRLPLAHSATGVAMLTVLAPEKVESLLAAEPFAPSTERRARDAASLRARIAEARARGYAIDRGESFPDIVGVAAPLAPWRPADPQLAIGVALPANEVDEDALAALGAAVLEAARHLTNPFERALLGA